MINRLDKPNISDKQIIFAEQYLANNRNATIAYKNVYGQELSDNTAAVNASKLLRTTKIKEYLKERLNVLELNTDYVLKRLKDLAETAQSEGTRLQSIIAIGKTLGMFNTDNKSNRADYSETRNAYVNYYVKNIMFNAYPNKTRELN